MAVTGGANADQIEYWNHGGGEQWVTEQERFDTLLLPCGQRLIETAALQPGERVLDVGCGNGWTTVAAARRVGSDGLVVGADVSGPMLERARQRIADEGVANARFVQADAQSAEFQNAPFDAVISRFGVMFFDDPPAAFANIAGALRSGGRLAFVCWQEVFQNEWMAVPVMAVVPHVGMPAPAEPGAPGPFALADADRLGSLLAQAGLRDIAIEGATGQLRVGTDVDDVTEFFQNRDMGRRLLGEAPPDKAAAALAAVRDALAPFATADGVMMRGSYWVVTAAKP